MKRMIPILAAAAVLLTAGTVRNSEARVFAHVNLNFGRPYYVAPAPVYYAPAPRVVVDSDDCYAYDGYYYRCDGDEWFRASDEDGPWYSLDVGFVPRLVLGYGGGYRSGYRSDYGYRSGFSGRADFGRERVWNGGERRNWDGDRRERGSWNGGQRQRGAWNGGQRERGSWNGGQRERGSNGGRQWGNHDGSDRDHDGDRDR